MLKVRLQGTKRDIRWFNELLKNHKEGSSIYSYDPKGKAAFAYLALTKEVMSNGN